MDLEHVNLVVTNPRRSADLLERVLGWKTRWAGGGLDGEGKAIHVGTERTYILLVDRPTFVADRYEYPPDRPGLAHVGILVDDLDDVLERLRGDSIDTFNHDEVEPGRRFYFFDYDEICWEVASYNPPFSTTRLPRRL
jgi:catechol 2,3-dioxygenase-like lactoylglutathione lyase family enzyme